MAADYSIEEAYEMVASAAGNNLDFDNLTKAATGTLSLLKQWNDAK